jgi:hypothetical protein
VMAPYVVSIITRTGSAAAAPEQTSPNRLRLRIKVLIEPLKLFILSTAFLCTATHPSTLGSQRLNTTP